MLLRLVDRLETFGMAFFFSAALVVGVGQVFARYVLNLGVVWSEEAFVKFTVWACLIGAARAVRDGLHVRVDLVLDRLAPPARRVAELLNIAINLVFCGVLLWAALGYLDFRYPHEPWRPGHPKLEAWYARVVKLPPLAGTMPPAG